VVKDGVSIIIGGLRKLSREKERKQVPFLGKIPFFGALFRNKKDEWTRDELVIVLTPRIVSGDRSIESEISEKIERGMGEQEVFDRYRRQEKEFMREMKKNAFYDGPAADLADDEAYSGERISLNQKLPEQETESKERSYYWHVMHRIQETASLFSAQEGAAIYGKSKKQGKIKLTFVISKNGRLAEEPSVVASDTDGQLEDIARLIIKRASPFLPLPAYIDKDEEKFEVLLVF
jgi:hypothetical protein